MKRRSRAGSRPAKARPVKALKLKARKTSKAVTRRGSAPAGQETEVARLTRQLQEASERQTATSEVLRVISSSPSQLESVFQAILANATRICAAKFGNLWLREGDNARVVATHGAPSEYREYLKSEPVVVPSPGSALARVLTNREVVQIEDITEAPTHDMKVRLATIKLAKARSLIGVPLVKENEVIGGIAIYRQEVRPFSEKQVELLKSFASQAVIAIENARLLTELRQRTADLGESLEQQTATSEVLQVISSSPGDLQPVFDTMLEKAARICDATFGNIQSWDREIFRVVATYKTPPALVEARKSLPVRPVSPEAPLGRLVATKMVVHIDDLAAERSYIEHRHPAVVAAVEGGGVRTALLVPMLKENEVIGAFTLSRQEVRHFTEKQIALVTNFASQAVIAIENTRLLNELRKSLQEQTATAEVLEAISGSPGDLEPVFAAMLEKSARICDAAFGNVYRWDGDALHLVGTHNTPPALAEARARSPIHVTAKMPVGRMLATKTTVHVADLAAEPVYTEERDPTIVAGVELGGIRTFLLVPMLKENQLIGMFSLYRQEVRPFTDKQIELVKNFAAQAVIAIENARLLNELRERTGQLEAQSREVVKLNQQLEQRVAYQVGEIERMSRLRRFLPPQVADLIVASGAEKQLESHRREITALFCDLRGFTGFSESADPEDVMALLREYHAAIGEIIIKYSGTLERYAGDGVMVVFNDPVPVPKPALQAVQAALDMRAAIEVLTEKWSRLGHDLGFGVGIAHGHATLGTIGFEGRFDYAAIGTVSNVASRLCDEAKPGQILISPRVLMAVEDAVTVEPVGEFELKGIRRPVAAYNVVAALPPSP